jgi:hypothetical protein
MNFRRNPPRRGGNNMNKKIIDKVDKLGDAISKLSLDLNPKVTNLNRSKKEPRIDKLTLPMNMGLTSRYVSLVPTPNRIVYCSVYTRVDLITSSANPTSLVFFPYCVNFQNFKNISIASNNGTDIASLCDRTTPMILIRGAASVSSLELPAASTQCGLTGNYRLVGATLKITNTSPYVSREGTYMVYRIVDDTFLPWFYSTAHPPAYFHNRVNDFAKLLNKNYDQVKVKQAFAASDVGLVNEFNVYEGNTNFQSPCEYIGCRYESDSSSTCVAPNPVGTNATYLVKIPSTVQENSYLIESWQVLEIIPDPSLNLDNLAQMQSHVVTEEVLKEIRERPMITKYR